ncbi:hypothetical protein ACJ73_02050 [Blastomyces percursus]|uniref:Uncharacterized protein n=1 Tax=Blastomyces percursus TaxID=1658174 RepID=A0A1J9QDL2_9EURO|nr:hypothetical protein ACJ73_02050 [Blastomyces percursus]
MVKEITKTWVNPATDNLLEEIKKKKGCDACDSITWTTLPKATRIDPPENSVAVVVDVVNSQGAIRIYEKEGDSYVDGVGTEAAGHMVIVPWDSGWWLRVSGSLQVGYAIAKNVK